VDYSLIFLCPPVEHAKADDGFRTEDLHYGWLQYWTIMRLIPQRIKRVQVPVYRLSSKDKEIEKRVRFCLQVLNRW